MSDENHGIGIMESTIVIRVGPHISYSMDYDRSQVLDWAGLGDFDMVQQQSLRQSAVALDAAVAFGNAVVACAVTNFGFLSAVSSAIAAENLYRSMKSLGFEDDALAVLVDAWFSSAIESSSSLCRLSDQVLSDGDVLLAMTLRGLAGRLSDATPQRLAHSAIARWIENYDELLTRLGYGFPAAPIEVPQPHVLLGGELEPAQEPTVSSGVESLKDQLMNDREITELGLEFQHVAFEIKPELEALIITAELTPALSLRYRRLQVAFTDLQACFKAGKDAKQDQLKSVGGFVDAFAHVLAHGHLPLACSYLDVTRRWCRDESEIAAKVSAMVRPYLPPLAAYVHCYDAGGNVRSSGIFGLAEIFPEEGEPERSDSDRSELAYYFDRDGGVQIPLKTEGRTFLSAIVPAADPHVEPDSRWIQVHPSGVTQSRLPAAGGVFVPDNESDWSQSVVSVSPTISPNELKLPSDIKDLRTALEGLHMTMMSKMKSMQARTNAKDVSQLVESVGDLLLVRSLLYETT